MFLSDLKWKAGRMWPRHRLLSATYRPEQKVRFFSFFLFETIARLHGLQVVSVFMSSDGRRSA